MARMMPPPQLFYQILPTRAKLSGILPTVSQPCPRVGGVLELSDKILVTKDGQIQNPRGARDSRKEENGLK